MRNIIHDQASHQFIEGPIQSTPEDGLYRAKNAENATPYASSTQNFEPEGKANDNDMEIPSFEINERYD